MENNYSNGKIYVIKFNDNNNLIYIRSYIQSLNKRFRQHIKIIQLKEHLYIN